MVRTNSTVLRIACVLACLLVGCAPVRTTTPPPEGPPLGTAAEWITSLDQRNAKTTPPEIDHFLQAARAVCPDPPGTGGARALSHGAQVLGEKPQRGCRGLPLAQELALMERLLRATPKEHEDWIRIVDRMALTAFLMEYEAFRVCAEFERSPPEDQNRLAYGERTLRVVADALAHARRTTRFACDMLARHPSHRANAPCDGALPPPPLTNPASVCVETNASFPAEPKAPGCEAVAP
ncbi:hypothetical protein [Polyangium sp. 15x6]|uniref:hypothetical protein n=1 Tax=Polyangium sp. 15x6 TaxID=3042687 RepID=UPI00249C1C38|nr:hypothetical protein [Polyangium sp. 15x6]MDI3289155.1 hypothetical protein [Polyangium sp. 15x6]